MEGHGRGETERATSGEGERERDVEAHRERACARRGGDGWGGVCGELAVALRGVRGVGGRGEAGGVAMGDGGAWEAIRSTTPVRRWHSRANVSN